MGLKTGLLYAILFPLVLMAGLILFRVWHAKARKRNQPPASAV